MAASDRADGHTQKTMVGNVVSTKMQKTIVVEVTRKKAHPLYRRVIARSKKFYAHDEQNTAHVGDVVRIGRPGRCPAEALAAEEIVRRRPGRGGSREEPAAAE